MVSRANTVYTNLGGVERKMADHNSNPERLYLDVCFVSLAIQQPFMDYVRSRSKDKKCITIQSVEPRDRQGEITIKL